MNLEHQVGAGTLGRYAPQLTPDRNHQCIGRLDDASSPTAGTPFKQGSFVSLPGFFSGHLHESQFRQSQNVCFCIIRLQTGFQLNQNRLLMAFLLHVDEIGHDDAADIPQAQLAGNFRRCFHVRPEYRIRQVRIPDKTTGVDVNDRQGFGFINDQIPAALQIDPAIRQPIPFVFNGIVRENLCFSLIQMNFFHQIR